MPVADCMTQVELWCITLNKCTIVEKDCPDSKTNARVTMSIEMCRNQMKRCRFGVQNGVKDGTENRRYGNRPLHC